MENYWSHVRELLSFRETLDILLQNLRVESLTTIFRTLILGSIFLRSRVESVCFFFNFYYGRGKITSI